MLRHVPVDLFVPCPLFVRVRSFYVGEENQFVHASTPEFVVYIQILLSKIPCFLLVKCACLHTSTGYIWIPCF